MITIKLNKELDYEVYNDFKIFETAGVNFGEAIRKDHPEINENNYRQYIDDFYETNEGLLKNNCQEINDYLLRTQEIFFSEIKELFGLDFFASEYIGYISIFNCNPRYVENKTFQIFYKKDLLDKSEVAFHESLHFAFFDFCDLFVAETRSLDKNNGPLWELSEIFNVIILNLPQFQILLKRPEQLFYPRLEERFKQVQLIWSKNDTKLKDFIKESLSLWPKTTTIKC
ncbi:MAG: hypothetical protein WDZ85_00035 [Candidatus Paceibacterota bacterium]